MPAEPETPWALQPPAITKPFTFELGADDEPAVGRERRPTFEDAADAELLDLRNLRRQLLGEPAEHVPIGIDRRRLVASVNWRGSVDIAFGLPAAAQERVDLGAQVQRRVGNANAPAASARGRRHGR